jgi:Tol biopolymer transport system component
VAFVGDGRDLYLAQGPDFTPRRLAGGPVEEPRWSPDGQFIVFNAESEGLYVIRAGGGAAVRLSPQEDEWHTRIVRVHGWIDDRTIGYEAHCGTGCQYLFELAIDRSGDVPVAASLSRILFVRTAPGTIASGLAFHYSPDFRFIAADYGGTQLVAWYNRKTGEQWLLTFDDDPPGVELARTFAGWDEDSVTFLYREAIGTPGQPVDPASNWTCWRADPRTRTRTPTDAELCGV